MTPGSRRLLRVLILGGAWVAMLGCSRSPASRDANETHRQPTADGESAMTLKITSTAFDANARIPVRHTGEGEDVSPALAWSGVPADTRELALICDDPDAPRPEPWVHWVIYKLPGELAGLPEGVAPEPAPRTPAGALQGKNSWGTVGYRGPMPPPGHGTHHYHFTLYALDQAITLPAGATKEQLLVAMKGHILARGELVGTYER